MGDYKIEALWKCNYCNTKDILGRYRQCPNCAHPRDKDVKLYPPADISKSNAVDESKHDIGKRRDWTCSYCGSYNHCDLLECKGCGASRPY